MQLERKQDLAVYYFIQDLFSDVSGIKVVDEFPTTLLTLPTIAVEAYTIDNSKFLQLGDTERIMIRIWSIDIFAANKAQRDEYGYRILSALETKVPVYDYDEGNPPMALTKLGVLQPDRIQMEFIRILPELVDKLYYRASVNFTCTYNAV